jgi:hypothetical protein
MTESVSRSLPAVTCRQAKNPEKRRFIATAPVAPEMQ